jgi:surface protein|nr:BspA family leucine-rich repeat surface protein [bacterium]
MGETFRIMYDLEELNISNWDVSNVTNMYEMFQYNGLRKIDIS